MYTPRNLRRKGNANRNGTVGPEKKRAFRAAKKISDRFIHLSASELEKPKVYSQYLSYKTACDRNSLRRGK